MTVINKTHFNLFNRFTNRLLGGTSILSHKNRITRILISILPIIVLVVGSCKTSQLPLAYTGQTIPQQFRTALFPANSLIKDKTTAQARPHSMYLSRAQTIIKNDPKSLMKLTQKEIGYLFGKPTFSRKDSTARVWQYKTTSCVIDFYFYEEGAYQSENNISYIDMRFKDELTPGSPSRKTPISVSEKSSCLNDVVAMQMSNKSHA